MNNLYKIEFKKSAEKELFKLPNKSIINVSKAIEELSRNPRPNGYKKLKSYNNLYRIRTGKYRVIYTIENQRLVIEILEIVQRKDAYKKK